MQCEKFPAAERRFEPGCRCEQERSPGAAEATEASVVTRTPLAILAALCIALGVLPTYVIPLIDRAATPLAHASATAALVPPFFVAIAPQQDELPPAFLSEFHDLGAQDVPQSVGDIREQEGVAERRLRTVLHRASATAVRDNLEVHGHVLVGHPVRDIVRLAHELNVELLVIGAKGHSALYERLIGSRASERSAARSLPCARC